MNCTATLLDNFWDKYPGTDVVQCGYDFPCEAGSCLPQARNPYCGTNVSCLSTFDARFPLVLQ